MMRKKNDAQEDRAHEALTEIEVERAGRRKAAALAVAVALQLLDPVSSHPRRRLHIENASPWQLALRSSQLNRLPFPLRGQPGTSPWQLSLRAGELQWQRKVR